MNRAAKNAIPTRLYYVEIRTVFDRPERRSKTAGYHHTPAAHTTQTDRLCKATRAEAIAIFNHAISGEWDFGSEYCCTVEVFSTPLYGPGQRTERAKVYRVRDAGAESVVRVETEVDQFARRMAAKEARVAA